MVFGPALLNRPIYNIAVKIIDKFWINTQKLQHQGIYRYSLRGKLRNNKNSFLSKSLITELSKLVKQNNNFKRLFSKD